MTIYISYLKMGNVCSTIEKTERTEETERIKKIIEDNRVYNRIRHIDSYERVRRFATMRKIQELMEYAKKRSDVVAKREKWNDVRIQWRDQKTNILMYNKLSAIILFESEKK